MAGIAEKIKLNPKNYEQLLQQAEDDYLLDEVLPSAPSSHRPQRQRVLPWAIAALTAIVLFALAGSFAIRDIWRTKRGSFEFGYDNELRLATSSILTSHVKFTGGIKFHDDGTMFRDNGPGKAYVGPMSPELDANWDALIGTRYLAFTEEQKSTFQIEPERSAEDGLYRAGPDVFHSLHCVNKLRQTIGAYQYNLSDQIDISANNILHLEHCLDFLRQLVQCSSDLTPIPLIYSKGAGFAIPDFEQVHTCRNFDPIHHWAVNQNENALKTVAGVSKSASRIP
jgi:hypothetical protein